MSTTRDQTTLEKLMPKLRKVWDAHAEHALAPRGSAAETEARARRDAVLVGLTIGERRLAATMVFTLEATLAHVAEQRADDAHHLP